MPGWLHWYIPPNVWGTNNSNSVQTLPENWEDGVLLNSFYYANLTLIPKLDEDNTRRNSHGNAKELEEWRAEVGGLLLSGVRPRAFGNHWDVVSVPDWRGFLEGLIQGWLEEGGPVWRLNGIIFSNQRLTSLKGRTRTEREYAGAGGWFELLSGYGKN